MYVEKKTKYNNKTYTPNTNLKKKSIDQLTSKYFHQIINLKLEV